MTNENENGGLELLFLSSVDFFLAKIQPKVPPPFPFQNVGDDVVEASRR